LPGITFRLTHPLAPFAQAGGLKSMQQQVWPQGRPLRQAFRDILATENGFSLYLLWIFDYVRKFFNLYFPLKVAASVPLVAHKLA